MNVVWLGEKRSLEILTILSAKILVLSLYMRLTQEMDLKSVVSDVVGGFRYECDKCVVS